MKDIKSRPGTPFTPEGQKRFDKIDWDEEKFNSICTLGGCEYEAFHICVNCLNKRVSALELECNVEAFSKPS